MPTRYVTVEIGGQFVVMTGSAPEQPTSLSLVSAAFDEVELAWALGSGDALSVAVERRDDDGETWTVLTSTLSGDAAGYVDDTVSGGLAYVYRVLAANGFGDSEYSGELRVTTPAAPTAPDAPTNLVAATVNTSSIQLGWDNNDPSNTDFIHVERSPEGVAGTWVLVATLDGDADEYTDGGLDDGEDYFYQVRAANDAGASAYSNTASDTTDAALVAPAAPTGTAAAGVSASTISVSWTDASTTEQGFRVFMATSSGGTFTQVAEVAVNVTSTNVGSIAAATTRYFKVKSYNDAGESAFSNEASGTTLASTPTPPAAPGTPSNITGTNTGQRQNTLAWTNNSAAADANLIYRSDDGCTFREVGRALGTETGFVDNLALPGTFTRYFIRSFSNEAGVSGRSLIVSCTVAADNTTAPPTVTALRVYGHDSDEWFLSWDTSGDGEASFEVQRSADGTSGWATVATASAILNRAYVSGGSPSQVRHFRVRAVNGSGNGAWSPVAASSTLAAGQTWGAGGRNPLFFDVEWKTSWGAAKAAFEATGEATYPGKHYGRLKAAGDAAILAGAFYPTSRNQAAILYAITGTQSYADACITVLLSGNPSGGYNPTPTLGRETTVVASASNTITTVRVNLAVSSNDTAGWIGGKLFAVTGANKNLTQVGHYLITAQDLANGVYTFQPPAPQAFAAGDVLRFVSLHEQVGNNPREQFMRDVMCLDLIWAGLSDSDREEAIGACHLIADTMCARNVHPNVGDVSEGDSDAQTGYYGGIACLDALCTAESMARPGIINGATGRFLTPLGGYEAAAVSRSTSWRDRIGQYAWMCMDGSWLESSKYNGGTQVLCANIVSTMFNYHKSDKFPELTRQLRAGARLMLLEITPGLSNQVKWGDNDSAHNGIDQPRFVTCFYALSGVLRGREVGRHLVDLAQTWQSTVSSAVRPYGQAYFHLHPALTGDYTTAPTANDAPGGSRQVMNWKPHGNTAGKPHAWFYGLTYTQCAHPMYLYSFYGLFRRGERVFRYPVGYLTLGEEDFYYNGAAIRCGLSGCYDQGPVKSARTSTYMYQQSSSRGEKWSHFVGYASPPPYFVHEDTVSRVYLPSTADTCDIVVSYRRTLFQNPRKLLKFDHYRSDGGAAGGGFTVQASPAPTATSFLTNLPTTNAYSGYEFQFTEGNLAAPSLFYDRTFVPSGNTGATITFAPGVLPAAPDAGSKFLARRGSDFARVVRAEALKVNLFHAMPASGAPTLNPTNTAWTTAGGQSVRIDHHLPAGFNRTANLLSFHHGTIAPASETATDYQIRIWPPTAFPATANPAWDEFLDVQIVTDPGITVTTSVVNSTVAGLARGVKITRTAHGDAVLLFCAREEFPEHRSGFTVTWTASAATTTVYLFDLYTGKLDWTRNLDGSGASALTVSDKGTASVSVSGAGSHTLVLA